MKSAETRSKELWKSGFYCAESVLMAIAEHEGITSDLIPKIATGFCSGLARTGGMCGALTGGVLAANMIYGRNSPDESIEENYAFVQDLIKSFEEKFGATECIGLLNIDVRTKEGRAAYKEKGLWSTCRDFVEGTTSLVVSLLEKKRQLNG
ncbi:MAG: C-GCAxxG-C-C family protein [Candidatus Hodarchaeota archaeon]